MVISFDVAGLEDMEALDWTGEVALGCLEPHRPDDPIAALDLFDHSSQWPARSACCLLGDKADIAYHQGSFLFAPFASVVQCR